LTSTSSWTWSPQSPSSTSKCCLKTRLRYRTSKSHCW
jgi:hypothetical protein